MPASKIVNPVGNEALDLQEERRLRRRIVDRALLALQTRVGEQAIAEGEGPTR